MIFLFGVLMVGLVLRSIGKSIEKSFGQAAQTINYYDNRQYHYTEVHTNERSTEAADRNAAESAPWRF